MNSLTIEATSLSNFVAQVDANFPFKTPLLIQALDSNNRVITDGPDSSLVLYKSLQLHRYQSIDFTFPTFRPSKLKSLLLLLVSQWTAISLSSTDKLCFQAPSAKLAGQLL